MAIPSPYLAPNVTDNQRKIKLSPSEGWTTVILATIMVLITVGCIQNLQWTPGSAILTQTTLSGALLGFVLAKQRLLPQWLADIPALALGIFIAMFETASADDNGNLGQLLSSLHAWIGAASAGRASNDNSIFLLFLAVLTMLLGYVSMWLIFRSRSPWLAVMANAIVLLINLNYATDDKVIFLVFFLLIALVLLVRFNLVERMRVWRRRGLRFPNEIGWDFMQAGVIMAIVVMLVANFLPSGAVSAAISNTWNSPNGPWQSLQTNFNRVFKISGGNVVTTIGFGDTLALVGTVNLPNRPVFTYTTTDPLSSYLISATYDTYDGHTLSFSGKSDHAYALNPGQGLLSPESTANTSAQEFIHLLVAPSGNDIFASGEPAGFSVPIIAYSDGIGLDSSDTVGSFAKWTATTPLKAGQTYQAQSYISSATIAQLQAVPFPTAQVAQQSNLYPPGLLDHYTQLPNDLVSDPQNEVFQAAKVWSQGAKDPYDAILLIVSQLQNSPFKYSTTNPDPPANEDAVQFLLDTHSGYCTFYATALMVMARSLGLPARVAAGFVPGTYDKATAQWVAAGNDAHAWAQVYFPGYGWISFEATPSYNQPVRPVASGTSSGSGTDVPPTNRKGGVNPPGKKPTSPGTVPSSPLTTGKGHAPGSNQPLVISLGLLVAILLLLGLALVMWWRLAYRALSPIGQIFARMALLGRIAGVKPQPSQTATEYGAALAARLPGQQQAIEDITERYVVERWAPTPPEVDASLAAHWYAVRDDLARRAARRMTQVRALRLWPKRSRQA